MTRVITMQLLCVEVNCARSRCVGTKVCLVGST